MIAKIFNEGKFLTQFPHRLELQLLWALVLASLCQAAPVPKVRSDDLKYRFLVQWLKIRFPAVALFRNLIGQLACLT